VVRKERRRALRDALEDLRRYRDQFDLARFRTERDAQRLVLQAMYVAVQASIDEANALAAELGLSAETYREGFLVLGSAGHLDAVLASAMVDWASMRNVLAHFYPVLDLDRVHAALKDIDQLEAFEAWLLNR